MKGLYLANAPMTEQAKALGLTADLNDICRVVYEKDKNSDGYVFHSLWHPEGEYGEEHIILPVGSTYSGLTDEIPAGTCFANVEGSTGDKKYDDPDYPPAFQYKLSWIKLIRKAYEATGAQAYNAGLCCAQANKIYYANRSEPVPGFNCDVVSPMHGAHVIIGATNSGEVLKGEDVFLLPLCKEHNTYSLRGGPWGAGYYMKLDRAMKAVKLTGYQEPPKPGPLPWK